jgi:hypothetical protein
MEKDKVISIAKDLAWNDLSEIQKELFLEAARKIISKEKETKQL